MCVAILLGGPRREGLVVGVRKEAQGLELPAQLVRGVADGLERAPVRRHLGTGDASPESRAAASCTAAAGERASFAGLAPGCIEAGFCNQIFV